MDGHLNRTENRISTWAAGVAFVILTLAVSGCAQSVSTQWAQTSPLIRGEGVSTPVNLGVRGN